MLEVLAVDEIRVTLLLPLLLRRGVISAGPENARVLVVQRKRSVAADNSMGALMMQPVVDQRPRSAVLHASCEYHEKGVVMIGRRGFEMGMVKNDMKPTKRKKNQRNDETAFSARWFQVSGGGSGQRWQWTEHPPPRPLVATTRYSIESHTIHTWHPPDSPPKSTCVRVGAGGRTPPTYVPTPPLPTHYADHPARWSIIVVVVTQCY